jgi:hypothetical protein
MKRALWASMALGVWLAACAPAAQNEAVTGSTAARQEERTVNLPNGPIAPELTNATWLNTGPLTPADLKGKIVLIDFWTFG